MTEEKVALVTGAGRGIGRGIALALAKQNFHVVINDLRANAELDETVAMLKASGAPVKTAIGDVSVLDGHSNLVEVAWSAFGRIDCLVNNAGISVSSRGDLLDVKSESFDRLISVNLRGPFFLTQAIASRMIAAPTKGFRSIITISSLNAEAASPDRAEYCLSKTGLGMMSKLFALRLAGEGIYCYEVRPGVIRTSMTAVAKEKYDRLFAAGGVPISRWGEPDDVGLAVAAMAGGAFRYSTGEVIHVDGGLSLPRL